jgi:hypothetical protein
MGADQVSPKGSPCLPTSGEAPAGSAARAHAQRRQVGEALAALREAEQITPEQVRGHELVRQLVSDLLTMHDPPSSELRDLAARLGAVRGL